MATEGVPVTPAIARRVLGRISDTLPPGMRLMPLGGTLMGLTVGTRAAATKDVDLAVLALDHGALRIPPFEDVLRLAERVSTRVEPRKDRTSVLLVLDEEEGQVVVEVIRGRSSAGGYFVSQRVLETAAGFARAEGRVLWLPPGALAFLKAWAAHDQEKLVQAGKDPRGFHAARLAAFRLDVERLRRAMLDAGRGPDAAVLAALLGVCGKARRAGVEQVLVEAGWTLPAA